MVTLTITFHTTSKNLKKRTGTDLWLLSVLPFYYESQKENGNSCSIRAIIYNIKEIKNLKKRTVIRNSDQ